MPDLELASNHRNLLTGDALKSAIRECGFHFATQPYAHQLEAFMLSRDREAYGLFMEMGTGKSKVAVDTAAYLYDGGKIDGFLVFGNKGSYRNWVTEHVPIHMPKHVRYFMTYWDPGAKGDLLASYDELYSRDTALKIFVMNIEALSYARGMEAARNFARTFNLLIVIDESTVIKNQSAKRTKNAVQLGQYARYKRIMTGSPVTRSPMDLFTQCEFLGPDILGFSNIFAFRNHFADLEQRKRYGQKKQYKVITGYKHLDELQAILKKISYRIRKDECLDLPPKNYETYDVELTDQQREVYRDLLKRSFAELESGELITAPIIITKLLRLHQVVCGTVRTDDGTDVELEDNRLEAAMDVLAETDGKVIIWATYRRDVERLHKAIAAEYGDASVRTYYGATSADDRVEAIQSLSSDDEMRFIVGNPRVGGYGTTMVAAHTMVYYSNSYDLEVRLQSEDRIHRIGQNHNCTYIDLVARGTVDEKIFKALRDKRNLAAEVLGDPIAFRDWLL